MCQDCGCGDPALVPVDVHERILAGNDRTAQHNREHFEERGVLALNLMGSPGAGKTAVLEATVFSRLRLAGGTVDLVLLLALSWTLIGEWQGGAVWGLMGGLCLDLLSGGERRK